MRQFLAITIVLSISISLSCTDSTAKQDAERESLDKYFWNNLNMSLDKIKNYKIIFAAKITTPNFSQEIDTTTDSVSVIGKDQFLYCSSKYNNFYTDNKYFIFFYPEKKSMYGESSRDKTMQFHCNILQLLKYAQENMISYLVDSTRLSTNIIINLPKDNILKTDKIEIKVSSSDEIFKIKNIHYIAKSKIFGQVQSSESNIDIVDYCFNNNKCNDSINLDPINFYKETGEKIILKGRFSDYKLAKFWQL